MKGYTRNKKTNYIEMSTMHLTQAKQWTYTKKVAERLRDRKVSPVNYWYSLQEISLNSSNSKTWRKLSEFLKTCSDENFDLFFISSNKASLSILLDFFKIIDKSDSNSSQVFDFYINMINFIPRYKIEGKDNYKLILAKIEESVKNSPHIDLFYFESFLTYKDYNPKFLKYTN